MTPENTARTFSLKPSGPFDLANQNRHFGGWPTLPEDPGAIVMAFPVEGSENAAAAVIRQSKDGVMTGDVHGCPGALSESAWCQALMALSLDVDASGWAAVGERDRVIGGLQSSYAYLRPVLFHSPYEAAAAFVIGHRISVKQARALRARLAAELGTTFEIDGERFDAFPTPRQLLDADALPGINEIKTERLHAIARAAQEGWLQREQLRSMPQDGALAELQTLPGIGAFFSQAILHRGAGTVDTVASDEVLKHAVTHAYGLNAAPDEGTLEQLARTWRPYRTWASVLLHVWVRSEVGLPPRRNIRRGTPGPPPKSSPGRQRANTPTTHPIRRRT